MYGMRVIVSQVSGKYVSARLYKIFIMGIIYVLHVLANEKHAIFSLHTLRPFHLFNSGKDLTDLFQ